MSIDRIRKSVAAARSNDDMVDDEFPSFPWLSEELDSPLDRETLDEKASTQMGEMWEPRRRGAN